MGLNVLGYKKLANGERTLFGTFKKKKGRRDSDDDVEDIFDMD